MTVAGTVEDIGNNTNSLFFFNETNDFQWFSFVFDGLADVTDAAHCFPRSQR